MARPSQRVLTPRLPQPLRRVPVFPLTCYLPSERVQALAEGAGWCGRHRVYDPFRTLCATVDQALHGQSSQVEVATRLAAGLGLELDRDSGALCRARQELPAILPQACAQDVFWRTPRLTPGPRVWLLDGSCLALAPSVENQARYPQSTTQPAGCGTPQLHLVALVDAASGGVGHLAVGSLHDHDARLGRELWDRVPRGDIVVADCGFASYGLLAAAERRGFYVVVRQHQRQHNTCALPAESERDDRIESRPCSPRPPAWWDEALPASLAVRVVRLRLSPTSVLTLNTNLPPALASTEAVLAHYRSRWRVETGFLELKVRLGLEPLRAETPGLAEKLLWAWLLAHNLVCRLLAEASERSGLPRERLSYCGALAALDAAALLTTADPQTACNWVVAQVATNPLPCRRQALRDEPRRVRPRHRAYPVMSQPRGAYPKGRRCLK